MAGDASDSLSALTLVESDRLTGVVEEWQQHHPGGVVARLPGRRSSDRAGFFAEASDALAFPTWFGRNWDAFWDCLTDLSWLPAPSYLLVIEEADLLLQDAPTDLTTLRTILTDAAQVWRHRQTTAPDGTVEPVHFRSLLVFPPGTRTEVARRLGL